MAVQTTRVRRPVPCISIDGSHCVVHACALVSMFGVSGDLVRRCPVTGADVS